MTTGRINQVTILTTSPPPEGGGQGSAPRGAEIVNRRERGRIQARPRVQLPGEEMPPGAIQLPPLNSPRCGPPQGPARPGETLTVLLHAHLKRRIPRPGHINPGLDGYLVELAPRSLTKFLVKGPTIHRPQQSRNAEPFGVRLFITSQASPSEVNDFPR